MKILVRLARTSRSLCGVWLSRILKCQYTISEMAISRRIQNSTVSPSTYPNNPKTPVTHTHIPSPFDTHHNVRMPDDFHDPYLLLNLLSHVLLLDLLLIQYLDCHRLVGRCVHGIFYCIVRYGSWGFKRVSSDEKRENERRRPLYFPSKLPPYRVPSHICSARYLPFPKVPSPRVCPISYFPTFLCFGGM